MAFNHKGWLNVATAELMYKDVACGTIKIKVEYMQFMSAGSKSMIGSMLTTDFLGYGLLEIFCI